MVNPGSDPGPRKAGSLNLGAKTDSKNAFIKRMAAKTEAIHPAAGLALLPLPDECLASHSEVASRKTCLTSKSALMARALGDPSSVIAWEGRRR
jgi:hypothetical protein